MHSMDAVLHILGTVGNASTSCPKIGVDSHQLNPLDLSGRLLEAKDAKSR